MLTKYAKYGNIKSCREVNIWLSDFEGNIIIEKVKK